jgi:hypothetical protein
MAFRSTGCGLSRIVRQFGTIRVNRLPSGQGRVGDAGSSLYDSAARPGTVAGAHADARFLQPPVVAVLAPHDTVFAYVDEAGNFDFSSGGTKYFVVSCLVTSPPFACHNELLGAKYELLAQGLNLEFFHASENTQAARNIVFDAIAPHLPP